MVRLEGPGRMGAGAAEGGGVNVLTESLASVGMLLSTDLGAVYCMRLRCACNKVRLRARSMALHKGRAAGRPCALLQLTNLLSACSRSSCSSSSPTPIEGKYGVSSPVP